MRRIKTFYIFLIIVTFNSCHKKEKDEFIYDVIVTETPANLNNLNSVYDDYNSDLPYIAGGEEIYFSSNRNSSGSDFDIIGKYLSVSYHEEDNKLNIDTWNTSEPTYSNKFLQLTNTSFNELGPFTFTDNSWWSYLMYASHENGEYNIKFVYTNTQDWGHYDSQEIVYGPYNVKCLNSAFDELYPTKSQNNEIYFCSNRTDSIFHIYKAKMTVNNNYYNYFINSDTVEIEMDTILSSSKDDKCPSIRGNLLVFTSNRDGGYGGYDLYYSKFINNSWTEPVNFGPTINTQYDEYRPITTIFMDYTIMIFSSNRPGGKGGFDLYCVKVTI